MNYRVTLVRGALLLLVTTACLPLKAQTNDVGMWYEVGAEKKIDKRWSVGVAGEFRTRNHLRTAGRWSVGVSADYKIAPWLKTSAGYDLLWDNNAEKITYEDDGRTYNKWTPHYWGARHRLHLDLRGDADLGRFNVSLRERWQYTLRPGKTVARYDFADEAWEDRVIGGKGKHVLRSRLQVEYNIPHAKVTPYASVELFNAWQLDKVRYTLGADWKVSKHHGVGMYYRLQTVNGSDDDNDTNEHIIGMSYQYKF